MKLIEKKDQVRRDFTGVYECEGCGIITELFDCYDDDYFHTQVMPDKNCPSCLKSTNSLGVNVSERITTLVEESNREAVEGLEGCDNCNRRLPGGFIQVTDINNPYCADCGKRLDFKKGNKEGNK